MLPDCGHSRFVHYQIMIGLILPASIMLYIGLAVWLLPDGRLLRAGLAMSLAALLPWPVWLVLVPGRLGPGAGIVMMLTAAMLLLALVPMAIGIARAGNRFLSNR